MAREDADKVRAREDLVDAVEALGYPTEFGLVLAGELRGAKSMRRMASYLRQAQPTSPEEIADEMLAILDLNRAWAQRHMAEEANARYWQMQRNHFGLDEDE